ncbi:MarR family winged helix-turn-helix transcriptional regulator [Leifsonia poae]|uniref:MarR family winged helix-turn-helix transcriptional regulator n=1 Tax=Leifsonia poae TaxID=110933 RepID=UPI0022F2946B|nr:MarR family winged helix-turn-helix transcriptional regulator [Leifsonia poae]
MDSEARTDSDARREAVGSIEDALGRFMRSVRASLNEGAHAFSPDLPPSAYWIMSVIGKTHPIAPATIIALTGMDKSSVSRQLRLLKEAGYIDSQPDPHDRRADLYSPTPEAGARFEAIRAANRARFGQAFDAWDEDEVVAFAGLLDKFIGRDA